MPPKCGTTGDPSLTSKVAPSAGTTAAWRMDVAPFWATVPLRWRTCLGDTGWLLIVLNILIYQYIYIYNIYVCKYIYIFILVYREPSKTSGAFSERGIARLRSEVAWRMLQPKFTSSPEGLVLICPEHVELEMLTAAFHILEHFLLGEAFFIYRKPGFDHQIHQNTGGLHTNCLLKACLGIFCPYWAAGAQTPRSSQEEPFVSTPSLLVLPSRCGREIPGISPQHLFWDVFFH